MAGAAILGASFLASTLDGTGDGADVPPIGIVQPASGDSIEDSPALVFHTTAPLELNPDMGWMARDLHLHAMVDDREIMPAAADIAVRDSLWTWRLPVLGPGTHRIHLTWAARHHGNLPGVTDTIVVHVR